jgi:hypothetical protein
MKQLLLIPDPRPLVERLGPGFFTQAPECPGVYLMRGAADCVLYVGKAKNLRKRLGSYRVANPDRLRRRHLRLLRAVERIEFQECPDEATALVRESELLQNLRPAYNRAGTWPGPLRFVAWRLEGSGFELAVLSAAEPGWYFSRAMGTGAIALRATFARLLWSVLWPERGYAGMPAGWLAGNFGERLTLRPSTTGVATFEEAARLLNGAVNGEPDGFITWIRERTAWQKHPFEVAMLELDLETIEALRSDLACA